MKLEKFLKQYTAEYNRDEEKVRLLLSFKKFEKLLGELEKSLKWRELESTFIQKSEDGKEWRSLNVMTMIGVEETLKAVKNWLDENCILLMGDNTFEAYQKLKEILGAE